MPDLLSPPVGPRHAADPRTSWLTKRTAAPVWVLLIEVFIGLGWLRAAVEKIVDPDWWSGAVVDDFLAEHDGPSLPWYGPVEDLIVRPGMGLVLTYVVLAQVLIGVALLTRNRRELALGAGIFLNLNFIAAGAVTPSAFYVLAQLAVLLWVLESSVERTTARRIAIAAIAVGAALAVLSLPFVRTVDPALVIEDPAIMLATLGALTATSGLLVLDRTRTHPGSDTYEYS